MKYLFVLLYLSLSTFAADWPCYRGNKERLGGVSESLQKDLKLAWRFKPLSSPDQAWKSKRMKWDNTFQVIIADSKVYFGTSVDNTLYCLDLKSGKKLWRFTAGGAIRFTP